MVTRISESPLYVWSSKQFPASRVISVTCHHSLAPAATVPPNEAHLSVFLQSLFHAPRLIDTP